MERKQTWFLLWFGLSFILVYSLKKCKSVRAKTNSLQDAAEIMKYGENFTTSEKLGVILLWHFYFYCFRLVHAQLALKFSRTWTSFSEFYYKHSYMVSPSREHIGSIEDSLMLSSITSIMHQFYIEHRKHWWIFDVTSMFHPCFKFFFHIEANDVPSSKHQWFIDMVAMILSMTMVWSSCFPCFFLNIVFFLKIFSELWMPYNTVLHTCLTIEGFRPPKWWLSKFKRPNSRKVLSEYETASRYLTIV